VNAVGSNVAISDPTAVVPLVYPASFFNGPTGANNVLPPTDRAFLGIWTDGTYTTLPQNFASRETQLGRKLDIYHLHYGAPKGACYATAPLSPGIESWAWSRGVYPFVSWSPGYTIAEVNSGTYDSCFRDVAQRFKAFGHPVWLRLWWEFNGTWMIWSYDPANAQPFIDAWRRVVNIFKSVGATNTMFVWSPSEDGYDPTRRQVGYPGDGYVDWVASSSYNWNKSTAWCGPLHAGWCEFWEKFHHGYRGTQASGVEVDFRNRKPYAITETGSLEDLQNPGRKGQWMLNARDSIKSEFPGLRALLYSDFDLTRTEGVNWRIDTSQPSLDGFKALAQDPYFKPN
jgi:Glycosyl hydrolase family 26